jgi:hypothetical protein
MYEKNLDRMTIDSVSDGRDPFQSEAVCQKLLQPLEKSPEKLLIDQYS